MIHREHYIKDVREFYDCDLVKIITGIRRCGKSVILEQIANEIKEKTDNIICLNFEDSLVSSSIPNAKALIEYVKQNKKQ